MMSNRHFLDLFWLQASHKRSTVFQLGPELLRHDLFPAPLCLAKEFQFIHLTNMNRLLLTQRTQLARIENLEYDNYACISH